MVRMHANADECLINSVPRMKALASPVRHQICLVMESLETCSAAEIAAYLSRRPETLYYHLHALERVGIIAPAGTQNTGVREETLYRLRGRHIRIDSEKSSAAFLQAMAKGCRALLRYAERTFVSALRASSGARLRRERALRIEQRQVTLSPARLAELNRRLDELHHFLNEESRPDREKAFLITLCIAPARPASSKEPW